VTLVPARVDGGPTALNYALLRPTGPQQHAFLLHPRSFRAPGEVVGAEALHRVLRGWLTDLGRPEPAGDGAAVGALSATARRSSDVPV
jgi:hypothetical protein